MDIKRVKYNLGRQVSFDGVTYLFAGCIMRQGEHGFFEIIIAAIVGVFVGGMIGTTIMALLSFRKLTEYEVEILKLRRRVAELEEKE